ncbi:hypothetical protein COLO4_29865 [Corchorus olitorius]|uniref:Uncharacterized protein n=1 Tax=Corchorus olitorius TaxID=93759 RepID=A0A1R3HCW3_9ROSI|nr:hypothetical protein COLO4_29865 [Corchorus olitorius]
MPSLSFLFASIFDYEGKGREEGVSVRLRFVGWVGLIER